MVPDAAALAAAARSNSAARARGGRERRPAPAPPRRGPRRRARRAARGPRRPGSRRLGRPRPRRARPRPGAARNARSRVERVGAGDAQRVEAVGGPVADVLEVHLRGASGRAGSRRSANAASTGGAVRPGPAVDVGRGPAGRGAHPGDAATGCGRPRPPRCDGRRRAGARSCAATRPLRRERRASRTSRRRTSASAASRRAAGGGDRGDGGLLGLRRGLEVGAGRCRGRSGRRRGRAAAGAGGAVAAAGAAVASATTSAAPPMATRDRINLNIAG